MPTVQNIGATDYSQMPVAQNQIPEMEEYMNEPQVYDPEMEEKKSASGLMKGLAALGIIAGVGGTIFGISRNRAAKTYEQTANKLKQEVETLKKNQEEELKDFYKKNYFKRVWIRFARWINPTAYMTDAEKEAVQKAKDAIKLEKEAEDAAKKAEKETKKAEKEVKKTDKKDK